MIRKIVAGGIIKKDNKFLLVKENKEKVRGKWCIPAGGVNEGENIIEAAKREIFEETGCTVEINGILEILNRNMEGKDLICFFFDTKLIKENLVADGEEISDVKWFTYEEILSMKDKLRDDGFFLSIIKNKINNKIYPIDLINLKNE